MSEGTDSQPETTTAEHRVPITRRRVVVWDIAVRVFHWSLVAGIALAWSTGGTGSRIHEMMGYGVGALLIFRLLWGFVGPRHARFRDFVASPKHTIVYLKSHVSNRAPRHLGHNPAGGYMILALLADIAIICVTGFMQQTSRFYGIEWVEELHHMAANALLVLVPLHVLYASRKSRRSHDRRQESAARRRTLCGRRRSCSPSPPT
jgi:cytochrome b